MPMIGNIDALKTLSSRVKQLTEAGFKEQLSAELAKVAWRKTLDGFKESRDPYGNPWKPLKSRSGNPLIKDNQLRSSITVESTGSGFRIRIGVIYAAVHQYGATIVPKKARALRFMVGDQVVFAKSVTIPRRQMVPMAETGGLGPIWTAAMSRAAGKLIAEKIGKAA